MVRHSQSAPPDESHSRDSDALQPIIKALDDLSTATTAADAAAVVAQRIAAAVDKLRDGSAAELAAQNNLLDKIKRLEDRLNAAIVSRSLQTATRDIFNNYDLFRSEFVSSIAMSVDGMEELHTKFAELRNNTTPRLRALVNHRELSEAPVQRVCDIIELRMLASELRAFELRSDIGLALLEAPIYGSLATAGNAMRKILGIELSPYWEGWGLFRAGLADLTGAIFPVANTILELNRQTIVDIDRNIDKIIAATSEVEKIFLFDEKVSLARGVLAKWRDRFADIRQDLCNIADHDFIDFTERLERYMNG